MHEALPMEAIALPSALTGMRRYALDGAMLCFDRDTGWTARIDGDEVAHLRRQAPRVIQFGITNRCDLSCAFCSRDQAAESRWTPESAFSLLAELSAHGVLEVAFGGGEPLVLKGFVSLVERLYHQTPLAISFTTNGTQLDAALLERLAKVTGQVRLSIYEEAEWRAQVRLLRAGAARFGINYLVTPARARYLCDTVLELVELGARDVLLLSYNGEDRALHLDAPALVRLGRDVRALHHALRGHAELKLDVCWGRRLEAPRAMSMETACHAGEDALVITSDRKVAPCSFHEALFPFETADDVLAIWRRRRAAMSAPARLPGCARAPDFGLGRHLPVVEAC